jgi:hypothetical protein
MMTIAVRYACLANTWYRVDTFVVENTCGTSVASVTPALYPAWEFYNAALDDYFVTADPAERDHLRAAGAAGPWQETGIVFRVWPLGQRDTAAVCRLYGNPHVDAGGAMQGFEAHFLTAQSTECAALASRPPWRFEGLVFDVALPNSAGTCPQGSMPVWRYWRPTGAPAHRFVITAQDAAAMAQRGWQAEGIAWCAGP